MSTTTPAPAYTAAAAPATQPFDFPAHLARQREFSERTFGPGQRTGMAVDHIRKELLEIEAAPGDLEEWIDIVILALDGAWRTGAAPGDIVAMLVGKQTKNEARTWPDWRTADPTKAIEHSREADPAPQECWSANGEDFTCSCLQDLLDQNDDLVPGDIVYFGDAIHPTPSELVEADDVIDTIGSRAYDIAGEYADGFPNVTKDATVELDRLLSGWIEKHCSINFYTVEKINQRALTAHDFDGRECA